MYIHFCFFFLFFFFFNDTATTEIYTLSLHDALPICRAASTCCWIGQPAGRRPHGRSEEHTSELQSRENLVCRLLLEKKKKNGRNVEKQKEVNNKKKEGTEIAKP